MSHTPWAFNHDYILLIHNILVVLHRAATQLAKTRCTANWSDFTSYFYILSPDYASKRLTYIRLCLQSILGGDDKSDNSGQEYAYKKTNRRPDFAIEN